MSTYSPEPDLDQVVVLVNDTAVPPFCVTAVTVIVSPTLGVPENPIEDHRAGPGHVILCPAPSVVLGQTKVPEPKLFVASEKVSEIAPVMGESPTFAIVASKIAPSHSVEALVQNPVI